MKKSILILITLFYCVGVFSETQYTFMLSGASFAVRQNGWFELGCDAFNAQANNKAVSGQKIGDTAGKMFRNTYYTPSELDAADAFIIMDVHNEDVSDETDLKENHTDYVAADFGDHYARSYDYVIKRYAADCFALKDNPASRYYGSENGKPAVIVFCTHWHDARTVYNRTIRELKEKWENKGLPVYLVEWDVNIGFTKDILDEDGKQPSLKYAKDAQDGYGWHPLEGQDQYIQQKMANIFIGTMEEIFGERPLSVKAIAKNPVIEEGEKATVYFSFTGTAPWDFEYEVNGDKKVVNEITETPYKIEVDVPSTNMVKVVPLKVSNSKGSKESGFTPVLLGHMTKSIAPTFDTYVYKINQNTTYMSDEKIELKTSTDNYIREAFLTFPLSQLDKEDDVISLRLYFNELVYSVPTPPKEYHIISIYGNTETYTSLTWTNKPTDFEKITEIIVPYTEVESFISWDVTDWVKGKLEEEGVEAITFYLKVTNNGVGLFRFPSMESSSENKPALLTSKSIPTNSDHIRDMQHAPFCYTNEYIKLNNTEKAKLTIYSIDGICVYDNIHTEESTIDIRSFAPGIYMISYESDRKKTTAKVLKAN